LFDVGGDGLNAGKKQATPNAADVVAGSARPQRDGSAMVTAALG